MQELAGSSYVHCQRVFGAQGAQAPAGMLFDTANFDGQAQRCSTAVDASDYSQAESAAS
jgi:hypothetical protein